MYIHRLLDVAIILYVYMLVVLLCFLVFWFCLFVVVCLVLCLCLYVLYLLFSLGDSKTTRLEQNILLETLVFYVICLLCCSVCGVFFCSVWCCFCVCTFWFVCFTSLGDSKTTSVEENTNKQHIKNTKIEKLKSKNKQNNKQKTSDRRRARARGGDGDA